MVWQREATELRPVERVTGRKGAVSRMRRRRCGGASHHRASGVLQRWKRFADSWRGKLGSSAVAHGLLAVVLGLLFGLLRRRLRSQLALSYSDKAARFIGIIHCMNGSRLVFGLSSSLQAGSHGPSAGTKASAAQQRAAATATGLAAEGHANPQGRWSGTSPGFFRSRHHARLH